MTKTQVLRAALVVGMGMFGACSDNGGGGGGAPGDAPRPEQRPTAPGNLQAADGADVDSFVDAMLDGWDACVDFCIGYSTECLDGSDSSFDYDTGSSDDEAEDDDEATWDMDFLDNCWDGCDDMAAYAFTEWISDNTVTAGAVACADAFTDFIDCLFDYGECDPATEFIEAELFGGYAPSVCTSEWSAYESACEDL